MDGGMMRGSLCLLVLAGSVSALAPTPPKAVASRPSVTKFFKPHSEATQRGIPPVSKLDRRLKGGGVGSGLIEPGFSLKLSAVAYFVQGVVMASASLPFKLPLYDFTGKEHATVGSLYFGVSTPETEVLQKAQLFLGGGLGVIGSLLWGIGDSAPLGFQKKMCKWNASLWALWTAAHIYTKTLLTSGGAPVSAFFCLISAAAGLT